MYRSNFRSANLWPKAPRIRRPIALGHSVLAGINSGSCDAVDQAVARAGCWEAEICGGRGDVGEGEGGFAVAAVVVSEKGEKGYIV